MQQWLRVVGGACACAALVAGCSKSAGGTSAAGRGASAAAQAAQAARADSPAPDSTSRTRARTGRAMNGGASGGGGMMGGRMGGMGMMAGRMGTAPDTAAAPKSTAVPADSAADCPRVSQALVNQGRTLFGSTGNCFACHGADAKGGQLGPNLTDKAYLDMNGTYGAIAAVVRDGVPVPKAHSTPMPPLGGAPLSDAQVCAVAAYVYSIEAH